MSLKKYQYCYTAVAVFQETFGEKSQLCCCLEPSPELTGLTYCILADGCFITQPKVLINDSVSARPHKLASSEIL